jgi:nucleoside-diphosphate-sugar epimerase
MNRGFSVLITGGTGFIGQHLVSRLIEDQVQINLLVRNIDKYQGAKEKVNLFEGDLFNKEILKKAVNGVNIVFHLASKTHDFSNNNDNEYFKINVEGTRNLLNVCANSSIRHFIYFSSVKAMTEESLDSLDENYNPNPTTIYGKTKLEAEKFVKEYGNKNGFKTTILRLPMVYGPGNKGNIYKMIEAIDKGKFIMIGNGENKRSMVYVENVIDAALTIVKNQKEIHEIYIVTDQLNYTVIDLYKTIASTLKKKIRKFYIPIYFAKKLAYLGDISNKILKKHMPLNSHMLAKLVDASIFSSNKIQNIGYNPRFNLYNTINETIAWYKNSQKFS